MAQEFTPATEAASRGGSALSDGLGPNAPVEEALRRAYYYDERGEWRGPETKEWARWHAVAKIAVAQTQQAAEIERLADELLAAQEALQMASGWLHAAYDRPPQTPGCTAMLAHVDALRGLGA